MVDIGAQLEAVERGALLRPRPELGTLRVSGGDRQSWLAGMVTADVGSLRQGEAVYALHLSKTGRVQAEVWVVNAGDRMLLAVDEALAGELLAALDHYLVMEDAELGRATEPLVWWQAYGPETRRVMDAATELGAITARGRLGELPFAMMALAASAGPQAADALTVDPAVVLATPAGWTRVRVERLLPAMGVDYQRDCYPQEAALEPLAVSFDKGCYLGQEVVFKLHKRGHVRRRLVRVVIEAARGADAVGAAVQDPTGNEVGAITSAALAGSATLAIATVDYQHTKHGSALVVDGAAATVSCPS